jgi:hypothetical protein
MLQQVFTKSGMDTTISRTKDQVSANLEGDSIILNVKSGKYYSLNPVGARVWALIESPAALKDIHAALMDEFEVEAERCTQDLLQLVEALTTAGLVQIEAETG